MINQDVDTCVDYANQTDAEFGAISSVSHKDSVRSYSNDVVQRPADIALKVKCYGRGTCGNYYDYTSKNSGGSPQANVTAQASSKEISKRVRSVLVQRLKEINATGVSYFVNSTEFYGEVRTVDEKKRCFVADVTNARDQTDIYEAKFDLDEVPSADIPLVQPGALFYWIVGREITNGTEVNISHILFRRMASMRRNQLRKIVNNAESEARAIRNNIVEA